MAAIAVLVLGVSSCKEDSPGDQMAKMGIGYFSVNQYMYDQWRQHNGNGFSILKTVRHDGKTDSTYTNSEKLDWSELVAVFQETDISDKEMLGHYKFTQYEDQEDNTVNFFYQAIDDYLFTRKLLISADPRTSHIKAIYIETFNHSMIFGDEDQKLFYASDKIVQIQKSKVPVFGKKTSSFVQYEFIK